MPVRLTPVRKTPCRTPGLVTLLCARERGQHGRLRGRLAGRGFRPVRSAVPAIDKQLSRHPGSSDSPRLWGRAGAGILA